MASYKPIQDMPKANKFKKDDILRQLNTRLQRSIGFWNSIYNNAEKDVQFIIGKQWNDDDIEERKRDGRPYLTLNKLPQFVQRVVGEFRKKEFAIQVKPAFYGEDFQISNLEDTKQYKLSEVLQNIIKYIEVNSNAYYHYKWAFQQAVEGGIGWIRVLTSYVNDDTFQLDIKIKSVKNRSSVLLDPYCEEPDFSDARWALIYTRMEKDDFRRKFPNARFEGVTNWNIIPNFWIYQDKITLAEYFIRYPTRRTLVLLNTGEVMYKDEIEDVIDELYENYGKFIAAERDVTAWKVHWFLTNGYEILDDTEWPGSIIPIIPVIGRTHTWDGHPIIKSLVADAIDSQRMHNYFLTAATEKVALMPKSPYIGPEDAFEGYEDKWETANRKNHAYLPYNPLASAPPVRANNVTMSAEEMRLALAGDKEIRETIGIYDAFLGATNEVSGKVLAAKIAQNSPIIFEFFDNFKLALQKIGKILVDIIPKIYTEERVITLERGTGKKDTVVINKTEVDEETENQVIVNDIRQGKYDVTVSMANAHDTPSEEFLDRIISIAQYMPQVAQIAPDLIVKAMQFPGSREVAERLEKTLPPELLDDTTRKEVLEDKAKAFIETQQLQQQLGLNQPSPDQQMTLAEQQMKLQKKQMEVEGKKIDVTKKAMEAQRTQAEAQKAVSETVMTVEGIKNLVKQTLAESLPEILATINQPKEENNG